MDYESKFTVFTDGSALNNKANAPAGWAVYIPSVKRLLSKSMIGTNNQAELEAMRYALWFIGRHLNDFDVVDKIVYIFSDSEYVINSLTGKWKINENLAKIRACQTLMKKLTDEGYKVEFIHAKAHTKKKDFISLNNDIVDQEARRKANETKSTNLSGNIVQQFIPNDEEFDPSLDY